MWRGDLKAVVWSKCCDCQHILMTHCVRAFDFNEIINFVWIYMGLFLGNLCSQWFEFGYKRDCFFITCRYESLNQFYLESDMTYWYELSLFGLVPLTVLYIICGDLWMWTLSWIERETLIFFDNSCVQSEYDIIQNPRNPVCCYLANLYRLLTKTLKLND